MLAKVFVSFKTTAKTVEVELSYLRVSSTSLFYVYHTFYVYHSMILYNIKDMDKEQDILVIVKKLLSWMIVSERKTERERERMKTIPRCRYEM